MGKTLAKIRRFHSAYDLMSAFNPVCVRCNSTKAAPVLQYSIALLLDDEELEILQKQQKLASYKRIE
jgi:hypothetical protein